MDIQKRIDRYIRKHSNGGSVANIKHFLKLVKIAEEKGRSIIISIDSPGGYIR
jgi:hypothetical protein